VLIVGGVDIKVQTKALQEGADILTGTPGRIIGIKRYFDLY
jgi:superfamily II DNA/RNA helicase